MYFSTWFPKCSKCRERDECARTRRDGESLRFCRCNQRFASKEICLNGKRNLPQSKERFASKEICLKGWQMWIWKPAKVAQCFDYNVQTRSDIWNREQILLQSTNVQTMLFSGGEHKLGGWSIQQCNCNIFGSCPAGGSAPINDCPRLVAANGCKSAFWNPSQKIYRTKWFLSLKKGPSFGAAAGSIQSKVIAELQNGCSAFN